MLYTRFTSTAAALLTRYTLRRKEGRNRVDVNNKNRTHTLKNRQPTANTPGLKDSLAPSERKENERESERKNTFLCVCECPPLRHQSQRAYVSARVEKPENPSFRPSEKKRASALERGRRTWLQLQRGREKEGGGGRNAHSVN